MASSIIGVGVATIGGDPGYPIAGGQFGGIDGFRQQISGVPPALQGRHAFNASSPLQGIPNDAVCILTDLGRASINRMPVEAFRLDNFSFAVGRGGYDPSDVLTATVPDPVDVALQDQVFPALPNPNYEPVDRIERPGERSIAFLCRVEPGEALAGLGELGVFAQIVESPVPAEIGDWIMFGLVHFPIRGKSSKDTFGYRAAFQF